MIYLDTHVVVWLYAGETERFGDGVHQLINNHDLLISPIVRLELQYLYEIQRLKDDSQFVVTDLSKRIGLRVCNKDFNAVVNEATAVSWTRDPFDRLIVANASLSKAILISKDQNVLVNYPLARW